MTYTDMDRLKEMGRLRKALKLIAAYDDEEGNRYLERTGGYGAFSEPASVRIARETLEARP